MYAEANLLFKFKQGKLKLQKWKNIETAVLVVRMSYLRTSTHRSFRSAI